MRKLVLFPIFILLLASASFALPSLQLYIPGATYVEGPDMDTWVLEAPGAFEVWVVADLYNGNTRVDLYDITLVASIGKEGAIADGDLDILDSEGGSSIPLSQWYHGTPPPDQSPTIGKHGMYPSDYRLLDVAASTEGMSTEPIYNYQDPITGPESDGVVFKYWVETTYEFVHFDAYGFLDPDPTAQNRRVAPFSHDAEYSPVPEPTAMLLFGLGLAGTGVVRRFRKGKK
ncbi:MAG: choice-of-anchor N protein [candidate division Zixibacteria bacterium]